MRSLILIAAIVMAAASTVQPTLAAENGGKLVIKTKSVPPRAPIEEKTKQSRQKYAPPSGKVIIRDVRKKL